MTATGTPDPNDPRWRRKIDWVGVKQLWREANEEHERAKAKFLAPREGLQTKAQQMGWAYVDLGMMRISPEALALIEPTVARELRVLPLKRRGKTLFFALSEPNEEAIAEVRAITGLRVAPVLCLAAALDAALARLPMA